MVTSDKALYSYAKTMGAGLMRAHEWNALERRVVTSAAAGPAEKPEREDDVAGWLERFGGKP